MIYYNIIIVLKLFFGHSASVISNAVRSTSFEITVVAIAQVLQVIEQLVLGRVRYHLASTIEVQILCHHRTDAIPIIIMIDFF